MKHRISFRCYFDNTGDKCTHYRDLAVEDIPKWIDAYVFTHPEVSAITVRVNFTEVVRDADGE